MKQENAIKIFEQKQVRTHWDEQQGKWYFSVIDVIEILTDSPRPRKYWSALKTKLKDEGSELSQNLGQLKMQAEDGKMRETDVADTETLLRIIQSIPSPKAEPFKQWLAKVGYERMQEVADPEQSLDRARENWQNLYLLQILCPKSCNKHWCFFFSNLKPTMFIKSNFFIVCD